MNSDLAVDRAQVGVDRPDADHQLLGHLRVGEPDGDQSEHIDLAGGQARRELHPSARRRGGRGPDGGRVGGGVEAPRLGDAFQ